MDKNIVYYTPQMWRHTSNSSFIFLFVYLWNSKTCWPKLSKVIGLIDGMLDANLLPVLFLIIDVVA